MNRQAGRHKAGAFGQFRIIAGQWRGRRLQFPNTHQLRPTPDRVRETLFNWVSPIIAGARCLDLYAGSGALGLEALSRGAAECEFVERDKKALDAIRSHLQLLDTDNGVCVSSGAMPYLARCTKDFDLIFLDPPFDKDPWTELLQKIASAGLLRPNGRVYLEMPADASLPALPEPLEILRSKRAGRVGYHLASARQEQA